MKQCEKREGDAVLRLIDVINKIKCIVAEYLLHFLLQSQLLFDRPDLQYKV